MCVCVCVCVCVSDDGGCVFSTLCLSLSALQSGQATSEGLRAIPSKRRMKLLLNFMKKNHKVRAWRPEKKNAFVYRLHPMLLRKETRAQPSQL